MSEQEQAFEAMAQSNTFLLLKQAGIHLGVWVLAFCLFAASDSWAQLTGWQIASVLNVLTGFIAGFVTVNLLHEWFHYFGARAVSGSYSVNTKPSMFIYDWKFEDNNLRQFYVMSLAGTVGGVIAVLLVFNAVDANSAGRAALVGGAVASFAFGSIIEWPVLARTRHSKDPLAELSKLNPPRLGRAAAGSAIAGLATWALLT